MPLLTKWPSEMNEYVTNPICYLCGSAEYTIINEVVRGGDKNLKVLKCDTCGLVRLSSTDHITDELYESSGMLDSCNLDSNISKEKSMEDNIRRLNQTRKFIHDKSVLDFGCGSGTYLSLAKSIASSVCGVELDKHYRQAYLDNDIQVYRGLEDIGTIKYDVITMFHVIEHLRDPIKIINDLKRFMHKDSLLIIETPNSDDALLSLYHSQHFANFTYWSFHLYLYNEMTLQSLLRQAHMNLTKPYYGIYQYQRYPIANHMYWLTHGKPNGQHIYTNLNDNILETAYEAVLTKCKACDTIIALCGL